MIVSLNRRYVFVHIHKCAGTSIEVALAKSLRHNDFVMGSTKSGEKNQEFLKKAIGLNKHSTAMEARQKELATAINGARVRIDAVRLIWKAPAG